MRITNQANHVPPNTSQSQPKTESNIKKTWFENTTAPLVDIQELQTAIKQHIKNNTNKEQDTQNILYNVPRSNVTFSINLFDMITFTPYTENQTIENWCMLLGSTKMVDGRDTKFYYMMETSSFKGLFDRNFCNPFSKKTIDPYRDIIFLNLDSLETNFKTHQIHVESAFMLRLKSIPWSKYSIQLALDLLIYVTLEFALYTLSIDLSEQQRTKFNYIASSVIFLSVLKIVASSLLRL